MKDIITIIQEQTAKTVNKDTLYKVIGALCVLALLYVARCCVNLNFKVLTFLNPVAYGLLHYISRFVFGIAEIFREIL